MPAEGETPHQVPTGAAQSPGESAGDVLSGQVICIALNHKPLFCIDQENTEE